MKHIFEILSGRPKDGDVIECIRPIIVMPQLMLTLLMMIWGIGFKNFILGILALFSAWQMGWGMSIERFKRHDNAE